MPYANREHICPDCGERHRRRGPAKPPMRCVLCSVEYSAENARQLHAKSGPMYLRWAWATATAARRLTPELTPQRGRRAGLSVRHWTASPGTPWGGRLL